MNILIISLARCGSSTLQTSISNKNNLKKIFEPYAINNKVYYTLNNSVVKTLLHQTDNKHHTMNCSAEYLNRCVQFYLNLIPKFNKVILLNRQNIIEQAESLSMLYNGKLYNEEYIYNKKNNVEKYIEQLKLANFYLKKLSIESNLLIDSYENIFFGNGLIDKTIELDYEILNLKYKLRKSTIKLNLI